MTTANDDWLTADQGMSRRRLGLLLLLAGSVIFLAGTQVQKHFGPSETSAAPTGMPAGLPSGMPEGLGQGMAGGGGGGEMSDDDSAEGSAVVGTLTSKKGDTWTVTDLGGTKRTITLTDATRVREERNVDPKDATTGSTVDISGTKNDKGVVDATSITIR